MTPEELQALNAKVDKLAESMSMLVGVVQHAMAEVVDVASLRREVLNLRSRVAQLEDGRAAE